MIYIYDGSFEGLLTAIFDGYKILEEINIKVYSDQLDFFQDKISIKTDEEKANRVKRSLKKISKTFYREVKLSFLSFDIKKEDVIANTIKGVYKYGFIFLQSSNKYAVGFRNILKNIYSENHKYKGFLRFREIQEGVLFAEIEPKNNILEIVTNHFIKRLPEEKFMIYDVGRKYIAVVENSKAEYYLVEDLNIKESERELFYQDLFTEFFKSLTIKERKNKKLQINNMPKRYWKHLIELN